MGTANIVDIYITGAGVTDEIAETFARAMRAMALGTRDFVVTPWPDPRAERARARAEIDAILREDAGRSPAFATARRCAVAAWVEAFDAAFPAIPGASQGVGARSLLAGLHRYEEARGGLSKPRPGAADDCGVNLRYVGHYERARGMR